MNKTQIQKMFIINLNHILQDIYIFFFYYAENCDRKVLAVHVFFKEYKTIAKESKDRMTITNRGREETHKNHKTRLK